MGVHAYCIAPSSHLPADRVTGIGGASVRAVASGGLCVWVSDLDTRPDASMTSIQEHNAVVVAAMTPTITPVPMRFGQWLEDESAARVVLADSRARWESLLAKFAGAVEYGIRVFDPSRESRDSSDSHEESGEPAGERGSGPTTGTAYMEALARRVGGPQAAMDRVLEELSAGIGDLIIDQQTEPLRTAHGLVSVAYLVHLGRSDAYREAVDAVRSRMPGLRLLSSGPWPPYSFVI